ncbi:MAG: tetratricopeptide repeat protein [Desulfovibrio sp.]|nr:tetratricopeptide repeat protein [Desulfovibrio sp.]
MRINLRLSFLCFLSFFCLTCFLVNNSGCSTNGAYAARQEEMLKDSTEGLANTVSVLAQRSLTPEAQSTYAYLLCDQAFRNEDEEALLEASTLLRELHAPVQIWMEAGIWLLGRKSPNAGYFLELAHKCWPHDSSILMLYAESLKEDGKIENAISLVRSFLRENPSSSDAKLELALLLVHHKNFGEAETLLKSITKEERTPLVELNLGKALAGMQRFEEAIPHLERAHQALPDLPDPSLELGRIYERLGQNANALKSYEHVLQTDFPAKNVLLKLISLSLQLKKPEKALKYLEDAPKDIPFQLIVADMFIDAKHYLQAADILKPIADRPDAPLEVYLLLADLTFEHLRDLPQALTWLDTLPETYKKSSNVILLRAHLYARADKKEDAIACVRQGKDLFPDETKFWDAEARILASAGKTEEALRVMRDAVKKWPNDMDLLFLLGNILDESGDKQAALSLMEEIVAKQPENYQALNYVGYSLAEANHDLPRAVDLLEKAILLAPDKAYIIDSLAWAYYKIGRQNDALREIRRAVKTTSKIDAAIWEHYGDIAKHSGLHQEAHEAYEKALELQPENANELQQKLKSNP